MNESPLATIDRLISATNAHDLDGIVACFADDYALEAPLHPARSFKGNEQVRRNWTQILGMVKDIEVTLLRTAHDGDTVWTEQEMAGTRPDGKKHLMRGVFIFGVRAGLIRWGRMFLEPVDMSGADMNAAVGQVLAGRGAS